MKLDPGEARHILRQCDFAALATHSVKLPGYPFVSHVPLALDGAGRPLMLFSRLAEHSRNLAGDARASLMVSVPGEDVQAQPRLTLVGDLRPATVEESQRERYLRYHPDAATYLSFGDFSFYRLEVVAVRLVAGFAQAGWVNADALGGRPLPEAEEVGVLARLLPSVPARWHLLGLDWEGLDLHGPEGRCRRGFDAPPARVEALADVAAATLSELNG